MELPPHLLPDLRIVVNGMQTFGEEVDSGQIQPVVRAWERVYSDAAFRTLDPALRAMIFSLGSGLYQRRFGLSRDPSDLDRTVELRRWTLEISHPESKEWFGYLVELATALRERFNATQDAAALDESISLYGDVVSDARSEPGHFTDYSFALMSRYEKNSNPADLESAIQYAEKAYRHVEFNASDAEAGVYATNFGNGLLLRFRQTHAVADMEQAIRCFEFAVRHTDGAGLRLALRQGNLGAGLWLRYLHRRETADLTESIHNLREALSGLPSTSPESHRVLNNLGLALSTQAEETDAPEVLDEAVKTLRLAVKQGNTKSSEFPRLLLTLGITLMKRDAHTHESANLDEAVETLREAAKHPALSEINSLHVLDALTSALVLRFERDGDVSLLDQAIEIAQEGLARLVSSGFTLPVPYRLTQQKVRIAVGRRLVKAHLLRARTGDDPAGHNRNALQVAEESKSRYLTEALAKAELPAPPGVPQDILHREAALLQELGDLDTAELSAFGKPAERIESVQSASAIVLNENDSQPWVIDMVSHLLQPQLSRLQSREKYWKQLSETWEVIRRSSPEGADYVAMRNGLGLDWEAIRSLTLELGPKTAIVSMFSTGPTTAAFGMSATSELTVFEEPLDSNAWDDISRRLLREVYHFKSGVSRRETWDRPLYPLMEKLAAHFQGVERVLLVLDSAGQTVPWAVVAHRVGWTAANGLPISVVTLPSLTALRQLRRRAAKGVGALVGGNPNGDLPYADEELKQVGNLLRSSPISGPNATTAEIVSGMRGASIIHLATHARFVKGSPLDSGVVLADRALTAREVMHHPLQADLLALSACESGMTQSLGGEEFAGLAQAFLLAGAQSVLVSLWNVNDRATATLMDAFYRAWMGGSDKATALSQAMVEVRTREGWDHPYYWGAFRLIGEWS